ncbi:MULTISPECIES: ribonucleotide reductase subunit alpha [Alishewanella]|uniref:Ribonucleotide reductase subunit alpha n=1 Tax=Alishewanella jeotgali KCTC 22429 TaxID=1129374 RepID=H3ZFV7_9ALTE|nr:MULTISPECIES: ribonucleotide reductase subunit alpha [Alishewanella]EHR40593.1 ribonucleotide reductase subunit alpha [Alishewanella jeotgali KCTC 22429]OCW98417.1 ribonucleotide reductase subunit alpha [Alishewanella sp. HH-ZS]
MNIQSYQDLLQAAAMQPEPQRLLFVFAKAELPNGYTDSQKQNFEQGQGGALAPVLCVDKLPEEVSAFQQLVAESTHTGIDWDIAFVSALGGRGGFPPNSDEAVQPLQMMMQKIQGGMIADFLTFDRNGDLVALY